METMDFDDIARRHQFLLSVKEAAEIPSGMALPTSRFVCLLIWDAADVEDEAIAHLARRLLSSGAVYLCAWGPDCKRVHDLVDAEAVDSFGSGADEGVVMTTSHDDDTLSEAVWFSRRCAFPDPRLAADCDSILVIVIGSLAWAEEVRNAFLDESGTRN